MEKRLKPRPWKYEKLPLSLSADEVKMLKAEKPEITFDKLPDFTPLSASMPVIASLSDKSTPMPTGREVERLRSLVKNKAPHYSDNLDTLLSTIFAVDSNSRVSREWFFVDTNHIQTVETLKFTIDVYEPTSRFVGASAIWAITAKMVCGISVWVLVPEDGEVSVTYNVTWFDLDYADVSWTPPKSNKLEDLELCIARFNDVDFKTWLNAHHVV